MNAFFHVVFSRHGHNKTARSTTPSPLRGRERNFLIASIFEYDPIKMLFKACGTFITDFIDHHLGLLLFLPTELISLPISNTRAHTHIYIYIYTQHVHAFSRVVALRVSSLRSIDFKRPPLFRIFNPRKVETRVIEGDLDFCGKSRTRLKLSNDLSVQCPFFFPRFVSKVLLYRFLVLRKIYTACSCVDSCEQIYLFFLFFFFPSSLIFPPQVW